MLSEADTKLNPTRDKSLLPDPVRRAVHLVRIGSAFPHCLYLQKVLLGLTATAR